VSVIGTVVLVARRELGAYLRAAVAYVVGVLFLAAQGASFAALVAALTDPRRLAPLGAVLEGYFGGTLLHWTLQLAVVSLIAMRTIAEDRRAGTWETLLTAPVSEAEAVIGKWLAAALFYGFLWLPTLAYLAVLAAYSPAGASIDPGPVAAAYAGEIAIGAAFLAVGVAWSAATTSQIVAGVGAFATLLGLLLVGEAPSLGLDLPWAQAVSPRAHLAAFARGEIGVPSLVALAGLTAVALSAAIALAGHGRRRRGETATRAMATLMVAVIAVLASILAARHPASWDASAGGRNSLDEDTRHVLARVDEPVRVAVLRPGFVEVDPVYDEVVRALERMAEAQPLLRVEPVDTSTALGDSGLDGVAREAGVAPRDLARGGAVVIAAGARRRVVDLLDLASFGSDPQAAPTVTRLAVESAIASALAEVLDRTPGVVCATGGHGELPLGAGPGATWAPVAGRLLRDGLRVEDIGEVAAGVPPRCRVLVSIAPARPLSPDEALAVDRYLTAGGALLVALPDLDAGAPAGATTGLELVMARFGLVATRALAVDPGAAVGGLAGAFQVATGYGDDPIARPFQGRRLSVWIAPRPIAREERPGVATAALVSTSADGWGETELAAPPAKDERDLPGPVAIAAVARARAGGSVVVLGNASTASSTLIERGLGAGDLLAATAIATLAGRTRPAVGAAEVPAQVRLVMTPGERRAVTVLSVGVIPLGYAALGLIVLLARRRRG
jgi:ABC-2 type transport system permease protein